MKQIFHVIAICVSLILIAGCEKADPFEETNKGMRTASFKVNGMRFSETRMSSLSKNYHVHPDLWLLHLGLVCYSTDFRDKDGYSVPGIVSVDISDTTGKLETGKRYHFNDYGESGIPKHFYEESPASLAVLNNFRPSTGGWIEFRTIDTLSSSAIFSGNFEFDAVDPETGEIYHVTEGTFDVVGRYARHRFPKLD